MRTAALLALVAVASAQTWTKCNPMNSTCPDNPALPQTFACDFTQGPKSLAGWTVTAGEIQFGPDGAEFAVAKPLDAPTIQTNGYVQFGTVEIVAKAAPGQGVVSSMVLESDDLDEVDWEFIGSTPGQVQTNFFGKGNTTTYDRMLPYNVASQDGFHTYTVQWDQTKMTWSVDTAVQRTLYYKDAAANYGLDYPQTPMNIRIGIWPAGDPQNNQGTRDWAGGDVDYGKLPYKMVVKSVKVTNANPGTAYHWADQSGSFGSIQVIDAGNQAGNPTNTVNSGPSATGAPSSTGSPSGSSTAASGSSTVASASTIPAPGGASTSGALPSGSSAPGKTSMAATNTAPAGTTGAATTGPKMPFISAPGSPATTAGASGSGAPMYSGSAGYMSSGATGYMSSGASGYMSSGATQKPSGAQPAVSPGSVRPTNVAFPSISMGAPAQGTSSPCDCGVATVFVTSGQTAAASTNRPTTVGSAPGGGYGSSSAPGPAPTGGYGGGVSSVGSSGVGSSKPSATNLVLTASTLVPATSTSRPANSSVPATGSKSTGGSQTSPVMFPSVASSHTVPTAVVTDSQPRPSAFGTGVSPSQYGNGTRTTSSMPLQATINAASSMGFQQVLVGGTLALVGLLVV